MCVQFVAWEATGESLVHSSSRFDVDLPCSPMNSQNVPTPGFFDISDLLTLSFTF